MSHDLLEYQGIDSFNGTKAAKGFSQLCYGDPFMYLCLVRNFLNRLTEAGVLQRLKATG